jgi:anti-anti-sigma factor
MNDFEPVLKMVIQPTDDAMEYQVIKLVGEMDKAGLPLVADKINAFIDKLPCKYCVFDFSDLNYINSEGIGFFMALHAHLVKEKKALVIISAKDHVKDVLIVIGILTIIEYHDTLEDFIKKIA